MNATIEYELWVEYGQAEFRGVLASRSSKLIATTLDLDQAEQMRIGAQQAEHMSQQMAEDLGQPHFDATYVIYEITRTTVKKAVKAP